MSVYTRYAGHRCDKTFLRPINRKLNLVPDREVNNNGGGGSGSIVTVVAHLPPHHDDVMKKTATRAGQRTLGKSIYLCRISLRYAIVYGYCFQFGQRTDNFLSSTRRPLQLGRNHWHEQFTRKYNTFKQTSMVK